MKKLLILSFFTLHFSFFISFCHAQIISTIAGNGINACSGDGGQATAAEIGNTNHIVLDPAGNFYFAGYGVVRKVNTSGIINTYAGNGIYGYSGDGGPATAAEMENPDGIAIDAAGNIYISDFYNYRIRKVNTSGIISTFAGNGVIGNSGNGGPATAAEFDGPAGICFDESGNLYIADENGNQIRKVNTSGIISTFAGISYGFSGDGGPATAAEMFYPSDIAVDGSGNIYIVDSYNARIRKVATNGLINTVAGVGITGYSADGFAATSAEIYPTCIAIDAAGEMYIADGNNSRIRKVDVSGIISTVGGNGHYGFSGDGGAATVAEIAYATGITLDENGTIYFSDQYNYSIRKIMASYTDFLTQDSSSNCSPCNGSATANTAGGIQPYTYAWTPCGNTTSSITGICPGIYSVTVVDANNDSIKQEEIIIRSTIIKDSTGNACAGCCDCHGKAWIKPYGGAQPYTYLWSNSKTTDSITSLSHGTYTVTVTDANGCTNVDTVHVHLGFPASVTSTDVKCYGGSTGTATASGGTSYRWAPSGGTGATAGGLSAGTYTVTINNSDSSGCSSVVLTVTVGQPPPLVAAAYPPQNEICNNFQTVTSVVAGGTPPYNYNWSTGGTSANDLVYLQCIFNHISSDNLIVTDANGCTANAFADLSSSYPLEWSESLQTNVTGCNGNANGSITVEACGGPYLGYTYIFTPGGSYTQPGGFPYTLSGLSAGTYTVNVSNGPCNVPYLVFTITQAPAISITTTVTPSSCSSLGWATVLASNGVAPYTYAWLPSGGTNATASNLSVGSYTVHVTDNNGCTGSAKAVISDSSLNVSTIVTSNITCYGGSDGSASSTISGGITPYTYSWSNSQTTPNISGLSIGTYTLNVIDASNCSGTAAVTITEPTQLVGSYSFSGFYNASNICQDTGCVQVLPQASGGTPPYTFSGFFNGLQCYSNVNFLFVTDANGCTDSYTENLLMGLSIRVEINNNVSCYGGNNGSATVNEQTGALLASSLNYSWSPGGGSTQTVSNLSAGSYTVTVTDPASSCSVHEIFVITQPAPLVITGDSTNDNGSCNGSAWANVSGGVNPYTYSWTGGGTNDTIRSKCFGNYCCTVTDANGCLDSVCVTINLTTRVNQLTAGKEQLIVYPNPNNGKFTIESSVCNESSSVDIYNVLGEKIFSKLLIVHYPLLIDLSDKANGVYFYRVIKEDGKLLGEGKLVIDK